MISPTEKSALEIIPKGKRSSIILPFIYDSFNAESTEHFIIFRSFINLCLYYNKSKINFSNINHITNIRQLIFLGYWCNRSLLYIFIKIILSFKQHITGEWSICRANCRMVSDRSAIILRTRKKLSQKAEREKVRKRIMDTGSNLTTRHVRSKRISPEQAGVSGQFSERPVKRVIINVMIQHLTGVIRNSGNKLQLQETKHECTDPGYAGVTPWLCTQWDF